MKQKKKNGETLTWVPQSATSAEYGESPRCKSKERKEKKKDNSFTEATKKKPEHCAEGNNSKNKT